MLYVGSDATYVVSRDMTFTKVEMKFPRRRAPVCLARVDAIIAYLHFPN